MTCEDCEDVQQLGGVYWLRVGKANVGIIGCEEHASEVMDAYNNQDD